MAIHCVDCVHEHFPYCTTPNLIFGNCLDGDLECGWLHGEECIRESPICDIDDRKLEPGEIFDGRECEHYKQKPGKTWLESGKVKKLCH